MRRSSRFMVAFLVLVALAGNYRGERARAAGFPTFHIHHVSLTLLSVASSSALAGKHLAPGQIYVVASFAETNGDDMQAEVQRGDLTLILPGGVVMAQSRVRVAHVLTALKLNSGASGRGVAVWEIPTATHRAAIRWTPAVHENKDLSYPAYRWNVTFKAAAPTSLPVHPTPRPAPTRAPTKAPASITVVVTISPNPVVYDGYPRLVVHTAPGASCHIYVLYSTGRQPTSYREHDSLADSTGLIAEEGDWHVQTIGDSGVATVGCSVGDRSATGHTAFDVVQQ